jgi:dipeptidyl aminopeptidase/acylaminoacyl peptidase
MTTTADRRQAATEVPYGAWSSPVPISQLTEEVVFFTESRATGGVRWWLEGRPEESGRQVLVRLDPDGTLTRLTPAGFNARTRVHEYGGGASLVDGDLIVVSDFASGRLQRVVAPEVLEPLTPEKAWRYADVTHDAARNRLLAVREDHEPATLARHGEAENSIVTIDLASGEVHVLVEGFDFYAAPRLSPDGRQLAWLAWRHPNMPWDGMELWLADVTDHGALANRQRIAGSQSEWTSEPRWSPDGVLHFLAEPSGFMSLYRWRDGRIEGLTDGSRGHDGGGIEFGWPDWQFGYSTYVFDGDSILAVGRAGGRDRLYRIGPDRGVIVELPVPWTEMTGLSLDGSELVLRGATPLAPIELIELDLATLDWRTLRAATPARPDPAITSAGRPVTFPTTGGKEAYGIFYPPLNPAHVAPAGELPPLIVTSHGGPTAGAFTGYATTYQLFTSRGIAVLDVDYGGSTGYGKAYRERLIGEWGIVDVDDCVAGARWLAEQGLVDGNRIAVRGGSASGYTTLCAITFRDAFAAGTSYFGIGDLETFAAQTHKFESRYLETLIGPYPEMKARYRERSPLNFPERIHCPALILQGADDRIVPPAQAEQIVDALWERRLPHAYLLYPGEDHGFRSKDNIISSFEAELSFYGQIFGFTPADDITPLEVNFLDEWRAARQ